MTHKNSDTDKFDQVSVVFPLRILFIGKKHICLTIIKKCESKKRYNDEHSSSI